MADVPISKKTLLIIFSISLATRVMLLSSILIANNGDIGALMQEDAPRYYHTAARIAGYPATNEKEFRKAWDVPLYPLFLALGFRIWQPSYLLAIALNMLLFCLACCAFYIVGTLLISKKSAFLAALLLSFHPLTFMYSLYPMTEPLFLFVLTLALIYIIKFIKSERLIFIIASGFLLGLCTLTKEVAYFFPWLTFAVLALATKSWRKSAKAIAALMLTYILVLSPVLIYNQKTYGYWLLSRKFLSYAAYLRHRFLHPHRHLKKRDTHQRYLKKRFEPSEQPRENLILQYFRRRKSFFAGTGTIGLLRTSGHHIDVHRIPKHPGLFLSNLGRFGWGWPLYQCFAWFYLGFLYMSCFWGIMTLLFRKKFSIVIIFCMVAFYFLAAYYYHFHSRYFLSLIPFGVLMAVYPYRRWIERPTQQGTQE